jgi:hypothetical protein
MCSVLLEPRSLSEPQDLQLDGGRQLLQGLSNKLEHHPKPLYQEQQHCRQPQRFGVRLVSARSTQKTCCFWQCCCSWMRGRFGVVFLSVGEALQTNSMQDDRMAPAATVLLWHSCCIARLSMRLLFPATCTAVTTAAELSQPLTLVNLQA